jgi:hypothetical protein
MIVMPDLIGHPYHSVVMPDLIRHPLPLGRHAGLDPASTFFFSPAATEKVDPGSSPG